MTNDATHTPVNRRRALHLFGAAGAGVFAAACAGPGSSGSGGSRPFSAPSTKGKIEGHLSFAHMRAEDKDVFAKLIGTFQKTNPNVTVRQDIYPSNDYQATGLQRVRDAAVGDVFVGQRGKQFLDMTKAGVYTDLSSMPWVSNYDFKLVEPGRYNGKQFGFPYQLVFNMPVMNKELVDNVTGGQAPKDWESYLALCDKLKSKGVTPLAWPGGDAGNAGQLFNSMVMNNGPSEDMCAKIESGEYKTTDDWFLTTLKQYAQLKPYFQPNATGSSVEVCQQLFASGKAAMLATGNFHLAGARKLGATFPVDLLAPITTSADKAKYEGVRNATFILGVNGKSKHQPAGVKFLEYLSRPDIAGMYANGTTQHVTVKNVDYTNPDLKALSHWLTKKTILAPRFQFANLDLRAAVEGACIAVIGGKDPELAAREAQRVVDQKRGR